MLKNNWKETLDRFNRWWDRKAGTVLLVADIQMPAPVYKDISELTDIRTAHRIQLEYLELKTYMGDAVPDMSAYLGPGSLSTFVGANPVYTDRTIWYEDGCENLLEATENCRKFLDESRGPNRYLLPWYDWSIRATEYYKANSEGMYAASMPDLEQNLDILSAVLGPQRLMYELVDNPGGVMAVLELLHSVWCEAFLEHAGIIKDKYGYTAFTHYNLIGRGLTSVLQSDVSCMLSRDMFNRFEAPFLRRQCDILDNVIYHLDGPGAVRHLDTILSIEGINAVQWVPGAGQPGNAAPAWHGLYDKIVQAGKGLYVFLQPDEIGPFLDVYGKNRVLIRTLAGDPRDQGMLVNKYI